jgi:hypothetical protein
MAAAAAARRARGRFPEPAPRSAFDDRRGAFDDLDDPRRAGFPRGFDTPRDLADLRGPGESGGFGETRGAASHGARVPGDPRDLDDLRGAGDTGGFGGEGLDDLRDTGGFGAVGGGRDSRATVTDPRGTPLPGGGRPGEGGWGAEAVR